MRRVLLLLVGLLVGIVVVGLPVRFGSAAHEKAVCSALDARVGELRDFGWENGITRSGAVWDSVLGDGVVYASSSDRPAIAREARRDRAGFVRLRAAAPASLRPPLDRLYALSLDPVASYAHRNDPAVVTDGLAVVRFGARGCGLS